MWEYKKFSFIWYVFSIIHDDKKVLLMKDLPSPLFPFVEMFYCLIYIDLISVSREDDDDKKKKNKCILLLWLLIIL